MTTHELDALKAQVRALRRIFYGTACLFIAGITVAATSMQGVPDVIKAKHFHVVGDNGKIVAALGTLPDGGVLGILNKDGKTVATISPDPDGGGKVVIRNKDAKPIAGIIAAPWGGSISTYENDGTKAFSTPKKAPDINPDDPA